MTCAIEDAGFQVRDSLHWFFGTGFPKSLNIGEGRGTALKPAHEPIVMARKPLEGTVAANVQKWGTGAINVDACRIETADNTSRKCNTAGYGLMHGDNPRGTENATHGGHAAGRWPANVLLDEDAAGELDAQSLAGGMHSAGHQREVVTYETRDFSIGAGAARSRATAGRFGDTGGASRFFYVAKPSRKERDLGCDALPARTAGEATDRDDDTDGLNSPRAGAGRTGGAKNYHPTVKPVELMRYLVRLVTPPGGSVLDPFCGSGTTGMAAVAEGFEFMGIEQSEEYATIARARIASARDKS
jgi:site-specific DNA-methyltransferase (adenine-specific)